MLQKAWKTASKSQDSSTQNGAVIAKGNSWSVGGFNDLPTLIKQDSNRRERPLKYVYTEHAERNAIYNMAAVGHQTDGATMWCLWAACHDCARAIIASGITRLVTCEWPTTQRGSWDESITHGNIMLAEAGVTVDIINEPVNNGTPLLFNGEKVLY